MYQYCIQNTDGIASYYSIPRSQQVEMNPKYNAKIGSVTPIITYSTIVFAEWGFMSRWAPRGKKTFRIQVAFSETIQRTNTFYYPFTHNRCIIPASELLLSKKNGLVTQYAIRPKAEFLSIAGIYTKAGTNELPSYQFAMVVSPINKRAKDLPRRIPVMLSKKDAKDWINPKQQNETELLEMLNGCSLNKANAEISVPNCKFPLS